MKTTLISKENNIAKFTMDFTAEEFEAAVVKAYQRGKGSFQIDGFRKGKAPRSIIEKRYGEGVFYEDALNDMIGDNYPHALGELALEVIDAPHCDFSEIQKGKDLTITVTVDLYPVVEVKDYTGLEVEQVEPEVTDETVDSEIENLRKRNARIEMVERPAEEGDTLTLDFAGFVGEEQFEGGTAERQTLKLGSGMFIPGFEDQLVGVSAGEKKDVVVTFPEEYQEASLAGKEATFHCTVHEVKTEILPEADDEFAKDVSEFDTLEELKADKKEKLLETAKAQVVDAAKDDLIDQVVAANPVTPPAVMVEDEIDKTVREIDTQMRYQGMSIDQYIQFTGKDIKGFRDELKEEATKKVSTRIILLSIAEQEQIAVTDEELNEELQSMAEMYQMDVEKLKEIIGQDSIPFVKKDIQLKKVIDMLYDKAKVKKVKAKKADSKKTKKEEE